MHPNKKILTSKNSPWLLCPSKSFPGKFYYFNGSTGETAWSNDADTKHLKKATVVTDKTHAYPEPAGPPADDSNNTFSSVKTDPAYTRESPNSTLRNNGFGNILNIKRSFNTTKNISTETNFSHQSSTGINFDHLTKLGHSSHFYDNVANNCPSPMFGQAVFPKYVSTEALPKVIWALTPMLIPELQTHKKMLDQITQYEPQEMFTGTLTNQFQNAKSKNPLQINTSTPFRNEVPMFDQILTQRFKGTAIPEPKPKTKEEGCQTIPKARVRTRSLSESTPKTILKSSRSVENLVTFIDDKSSSPTEVDDSATNMDKLSALKEDDLRFLLVAKRRQSVNLGDIPNSKEPTKQNTPSENVNTKKRVTFDLQDQDSGTEDTQSNGSLSPHSLEMECPEPSGNVSEAGNIWYIAVDTSVLLEEFEYIEQSVLNDKNCRLVIPYVVKLKIESQSKDDGTIGRQKTIAARQILRKLATPNTHIIVQRKPETLGACEEDAILKCCWQLHQDSQVVLITDNQKLLDKAKIIDIEYYTFDDFKNAIKPTEPQEPFDFKKVKITVNNEQKPTQNLFQQTLEELNPFGLTQRVDYPVRTLFENQNDVNRIVFGKKNYNDKLINLTNTNKALKNISHDVDDINHDISRLEITEQMSKINQTIFDIDSDVLNNRKQNQVKQFSNKDTIKISGITKLNASFDLDDELVKFRIKSDVMENRIKSRRDEWICRLTQIMEEALTDYLIKEKFKFKKIIPPWSFCEAVLVTGEKLKKEPNIRAIVEKFNIHIFNCSSNGQLNKNMKPIDVIKLVGLSMILIQNLKETVDCIEFNEADDKLNELIKNIEDPKTDIEFDLESVRTPVLRRSDEIESRTPMSYLNRQSEVLEYLKKHFTAMQNYEVEKEPKVLRTIGKDLNTVIISNNKCVTVENKVKEKVEPKVIRNVKAIDAYEEKFKKIDFEELDYENSITTITSENGDFVDEMAYSTNNEETLKVTDLSECSVLEESLSSTFYNECILAYPLLKTFLTEMRSTFMQIYRFISESMQDYQDRELYKDKRADINIKTNMAHKYIMKIVDRLQSIIARESSDGPTIRDLLVQAGDYVEEDETMAKYKDVVTRYLEQAQILEDALKFLINLTRDNSEIESISIKD